MRRMRLGALICSVLLLASSPAPQPRMSYRDLIEQFRSGSNDAIKRLVDLPDEEIDRGVAQATDMRAGWPVLSIDAAMLLHTEAGMLLARDADSRAWPHVQIAADLARAAVRDRENCWFAFRWVAALDAETRQHPDARMSALRDNLQKARWYREAKQVQDAAFAELNAATDQRAARNARDLPVLDLAGFRTAEAEFDNAFRQSGILLAEVHFGRIAMIRGRDRQAREHLETALRDSIFPVTRYYAQLLLGSLEEREKRFDEAERLYREALSAVPRSQSAALALSALLAGRERQQDALSVLVPVMPETEARRAFDPWWTYLPPEVSDLGWLLAELRAETRQ